MELSLEDQARKVIGLLKVQANRDQPLHSDSPIFKKALEWIRIAPGKLDPSLQGELMSGVCSAFRITQAEVVAALEGVEIRLPQAEKQLDDEERLERELPKEGWLAKYVEYTRYNEAPLSYHVLCGLAAMGCAVGRKCYLDEELYKIYAPINTILIGPTGVVHKSSAVDMAKYLIIEASLCSVMADKITAEAIVTSLTRNNEQLIYAPEFSVFFGRQRYNEGLTTLILRLLDYPSAFEIETVGRGIQKIDYPTVSVIGGSTMSLLSGASQDIVMSGGFLNRFLPVVESSTPRVFPRPRKGPGEVELIKGLTWLKHMTGSVKLCEGSPGDQFYIDWYYRRKKALRDDPTQAELTQRGPVHLKRIAMLIHLMDCNTLTLCDKCLKVAAAILAYIESKAPEITRAINTSQQTTFTDYVIEALVRLGGAAEHSTLLRRVSSKLNAAQFKQVIQTLNESGRLKKGKKGVADYYILRTEEAQDAVS